MKHFFKAFLCLLGLMVTLEASAADWVGNPAPAFRLQDQNGQWHELKDFKGQWLALYFYPKDNTPGCTEEAKKFRDRFTQFQANDIAVLGVSLDSVESHKGFAEKLGLPFPILSDTDHKLAKAMGVLRGFGILSYARRETFLIDPQGTIVYHYPEVDTGSHADKVLEDVRKLSQKPGS
jgi:peroxiredoxin Q/BCP